MKSQSMLFGFFELPYINCNSSFQAIRVFRVNRVKGASQACQACLATLVQEDPRETEVTLGTKACQGWGFRDPWDQEGCQVYRGHRAQAHREPQEREDRPVSQVGRKL